MSKVFDQAADEKLDWRLDKNKIDTILCTFIIIFFMKSSMQQ